MSKNKVIAQEQDSLPESAELLRLALPLMAKNKVPVTPPNYAVWYEYVSGGNASLQEAMDKVLDSGQLVDCKKTASFFAEYIDSLGELSLLEQSQMTFMDLHEKVSSILQEGCGTTTQYGASLEKYQESMNNELNISQLKMLISDLSASTATMVEDNESLLTELEDTREEVHALKEQLQKVKKQAVTDPMTSLANRKAFFDEVEELQDNGVFTETRHSVFMVDIDHFKQVNDTFGHLFGDKVIKSVAQVLKRNTRGKDTAARFGGEEFVVLLLDTNLRGAGVVAENIRRTIEKGKIVSTRSSDVVTRVTVSIGITECMAGDTIEDVILRADKALYAAKDAGRNRVMEAETGTVEILAS